MKFKVSKRRILRLIMFTNMLQQVFGGRGRRGAMVEKGR
jgi:hypothetical protein